MKTLAVLVAILPMLSFFSDGSDRVAFERVVCDFTARGAKAWPALNDGVMGGLSRGGARIEDGVMVFEGRTRLENNGGFSSIRSRGERFDLTGANELLVRLRANADRKYVFIIQAEAEGARRPISYWQKFSVIGDAFQTVRLALGDFYPTFRGTKLDGYPLELDRITSLGLMVYDGKAGAFRMEVEGITAFSTTTSTPAPSEAEREESAPAAASGPKNIVGLARSAGTFEILLAAAEAAGLDGTLAGSGPFTVLAPSDEAFKKLPEGTVEKLLLPRNAEQLRQVLLFHVVPGRRSARDLLTADSLPTLQGQELRFGLVEGRLRTGETTIVANDLEASNGIVHVIDRVLLPEMKRTDPVLALLDKAVDRGVPLFNEGQPVACAAIYEVALTAVLGLADDRLTPSLRSMIGDALRTAGQARNGSDSAWALRRAIDAVYRSLD